MGPEHLETAPDAVLDPRGFGDEAWVAAVADGDAVGAREAFVASLREGPTRTNPETDLLELRRRWFDAEVGYERGFHLDPDSVVEKRHVGVYGIEHEFGAAIDWFHDPTTASEDDDVREWQWQLNRHYQWVTLADAYEETGDGTYAQAFEEELRGWLAQCPRPGDSGNYHPSAWRTIEAGIRAGWVWPYVFEPFRHSEDVTDEALWLWVCSFRDHGRHLLRHVTANNWKAMESNGLAHVGAMFPELDGARTFLTTGVDRTVAELERQFYPDGLQTELAPGYALVSIANTYSALQIAAARGDDALVPRRSLDRFEEIGDGYARLAAPNGETPPLHDSRCTDVELIYEEFVGGEDPPWESDEPDLLPWGGYGILRGGGRYAMLDAGPYGTAHQHQDALQVVGFADGAWVLVDPGTPRYTDAAETRHILSAAGHNLALLDGQRHRIRPEIHRTEEPLPVTLAAAQPVAVTAATRSFETDDGALFDHERVLCDVTGVGWLVFDRLDPRDDADHHAEWLWQSPGEWTVDGGGASVELEGGPTLRVEHAGTRPCTVQAVSAMTDPYRGWAPVGETRDPGPLPTLRVETATESGPVEMITLLSTEGARLPAVSFDGSNRTATVETADGDSMTLTFTGGDGIGCVGCEHPAGTASLALTEHALTADD